MEELNLQTIHDWHFRKRHTCHAQDEFAELLNSKSLQLEFSKLSLCHFWIWKRYECPVISDLAIHKFLTICYHRHSHLKQPHCSVLYLEQTNNKNLCFFHPQLSLPGANLLPGIKNSSSSELSGTCLTATDLGYPWRGCIKKLFENGVAEQKSLRSLVLG